MVDALYIFSRCSNTSYNETRTLQPHKTGLSQPAETSGGVPCFVLSRPVEVIELTLWGNFPVSDDDIGYPGVIAEGLCSQPIYASLAFDPYTGYTESEFPPQISLVDAPGARDQHPTLDPLKCGSICRCP